MQEKVLIYRDYGVGDLRGLEKGLKEYFEPRKMMVEYTDATAIIKENALNENVALFVMPGGAATPFLEKLKVQGNEKIKDYVHQGGHYLGVCAGAYYACTKVAFETDIEPLAIVRNHELLDLVEAEAVGTLHKELGIRPYMKNEASGATVKLKWADDEIHYAHYHGGPKFEALKDGCEVLATYADIKGEPPAIIAQTFGRGRVVLSGVHFEDKGADLKKALHALRVDIKEAARIADELEQNEPSRKQLFDKIMRSIEK
ncbi:MAG TPA: hypothetical protein DIC64_00350 [Alphaproteobacteria bacterium]|nr:hypothetical protein [Alphaproteobacteria bacterium]